MSDPELDSEAIKAASDYYDSDIFFYSGEIDYDGFGKLVTAVCAVKSRKNVLLILVTNGGSANAGYQIARLLQKMYAPGCFKMYVPSYCKSAGTLIALGANGLILDMNSELGPLDVQLLKQDEIGTRRSGLLSRSTFEALEDASFGLFEHLMLEIKRRSFDLISFKLAAEVSSKMVGDLLAPVFGQISPDAVGSDWRDLKVAYHYGLRLVSISENAPTATVKHLVEHYPSHDFVIDNEEAGLLFHDVEEPQPELYRIMESLVEIIGDSAYNEDTDGVVLALTKLPSAPPKEEEANDGKEGPDNPDPSDEGRLDEDGGNHRPGDPQP